jgi:hypothetical protein
MPDHPGLNATVNPRQGGGCIQLDNASSLVTNSQKRNRIWIANDIIGALDVFAARAGRREVSRL